MRTFKNLLIGVLRLCPRCNFVNFGDWHGCKQLFISLVATSWFGVFINTLVPKLLSLSPCNLSYYLQVVLDKLKPGARFHIRVLGHARHRSPGNIQPLRRLVDGVTKLLHASVLYFIHIRTRRKKKWEQKVVYWTKQFVHFPKFSKSWIKIWTSHFFWNKLYLCEKLFVIRHQRSLRVQTHDWRRTKIVFSALHNHLRDFPRFKK